MTSKLHNITSERMDYLIQTLRIGDTVEMKDHKEIRELSIGLRKKNSSIFLSIYKGTVVTVMGSVLT